MLLEAIGFGAAQGIVLVILLVTARRVRMMKKEMDKVGAQVTNYLNIVLENEEENAPDADIARIENAKKDEEENRIISTVLQEIFPWKRAAFFQKFDKNVSVCYNSPRNKLVTFEIKCLKTQHKCNTYSIR